MKEFREFWRRYARNKAAVAGTGVLIFIVLASVVGPWIYQVSPYDMLGRPASPPSLAFPLGTDVSGRDILAGILVGGRVSIFVGVASSLFATVLGLLIGSIAGFCGGNVDAVLMRIVDFFLTIPSFILVVVIVAILTPSVGVITFTIAIVSWPQVARLVRAEVLSQRNREYVLACRGLGIGGAEIVVVQILPNVVAPVIIIAALMVASAILTESGLAFMGLGDPDIVSWGYMIGVARTALQSAPWMSAIPGVAIMITVLAVNLVGEGLNEAFNRRMDHT